MQEKRVDLVAKCRRYIGNRSTYFWNDLWGSDSFRHRFSRVFELDLDKDCMVVDRIHLDNWGSVLRHDPRGGAELIQFHRFNI